MYDKSRTVSHQVLIKFSRKVRGRETRIEKRKFTFHRRETELSYFLHVTLGRASPLIIWFLLHSFIIPHRSSQHRRRNKVSRSSEYATSSVETSNWTRTKFLPFFFLFPLLFGIPSRTKSARTRNYVKKFLFFSFLAETGGKEAPRVQNRRRA